MWPCQQDKEVRSAAKVGAIFMSENCIDCPPSVTISLWSNSSSLKGALSGQRYFLATESPLKMMKNDFYFTSKSSFRSQDI